MARTKQRDPNDPAQVEEAIAAVLALPTPNYPEFTVGMFLLKMRRYAVKQAKAPTDRRANDMFFMQEALEKLGVVLQPDYGTLKSKTDTLAHVVLPARRAFVFIEELAHFTKIYESRPPITLGAVKAATEPPRPPRTPRPQKRNPDVALREHLAAADKDSDEDPLVI